MKSLYGLSASILLFMIFIVKIAVPVYKAYKEISKIQIKIFDENSTEETDRASLNEKFEIAGIIPLHYYFTQKKAGFIHSFYTPPFLLPSLYFTVPTPPPWFKS